MGRYRGRHAAARHTEFASARLRRGVSSAAIAAAAMAALTASQAPGIELVQPAGEDDGAAESMPEGTPGDDSYHTELPPLHTPAPPEAGGPGVGGPDEAGIPATVLAAYQKAQRSLAGSDPGCNLPWELLAAIGKVESGQARGGAVDEAGTTLTPILGPQLNGQGFARIMDTDGGVHDGDPRFDRAVGPMQFIPSTWSTWGADGNGDGRQDPNNIFDAALAAGSYLCHGERDLAVKADLDRAVLSYNHSREYLATVLAWLEFYRDGVHEVPDGSGVLPTSPGAGDLGGGRDGSANEGRDRNGGGDGGDGDGGKRPGGLPAGEENAEGGGDPDTPSDGPSNDPSDDPSTDPAGPGDPSDDPSQPTDPTGPSDPTEPTDPTDPADPVDDAPAALEPVEGTQVEVTAGQKITGGFPVRVTTKDGAPVPDAQVRYVIEETAGARFPGGALQAEVPTNAEGVATAPELQAGQSTGTFTVRATVAGHGEVTAAEFTTTVKPAPEPKADALQQAGGEGAITAQTGDVCPAVQILATYGGKPAAGVAVTATILSSEGEATAAGTGPYFAAEDGSQAHTRPGLRTNDEGRLTLPELHAGAEPGTYRLLLTTADGGRLVIDVEVGEPAPAESP